LNEQDLKNNKVLLENFGELPLGQLKSIYEVLEEVVSKNTINKLDNAFTDELPSELKTSIISHLQEKVVLENCLLALRRFIHRFLLNSSFYQNLVDPESILSMYLNDETFWKPNSFKMKMDLDKLVCEAFPDDLKVKHAFSLFLLIETDLQHQNVSPIEDITTKDPLFRESAPKKEDEDNSEDTDSEEDVKTNFDNSMF